MRRTLHKLFWIWDYDKEEIWLNEMADKGFSLVSVGICSYEFEETSPAKHMIRLEYLDKTASNIESEAYIRFAEETGEEYIGNVKNRWAYFRNERTNAGKSFASDKSLLLKQVSKLLVLMRCVLLLITCSGLLNVGMYFATLHNKANLFIGLINLAIAAYFTTGAMKLSKQKKILLSEMKVFE